MRASEIMTRQVVTVSPDASVAEVASIMVDHRISGVPVVDQNQLVGIVTENDLLRRVETGTEKTRPRWLRFLTSDGTLLVEYVKSRGQTARDVMTPNVLTVRLDSPVSDIADLMESRHIKRVPVVDGEQIVGIVSRANLVQALATLAAAPSGSAATSDADIHDAVCAEIAKAAWAGSPITNNVTVSEGVVHLWGFVAGDDERKAVLIAARRIPGVKEVRDHRTDLMLRRP